MNRYVVGSYTSPQEAIEAVRKLQEEGYRKEAITLVSSTESKNSISTTTDVEVSTDEAVTNQKTNAKRSDDRSAWEKIKGIFLQKIMMEKFLLALMMIHCILTKRTLQMEILSL